jgi:hypothetical protein
VGASAAADAAAYVREWCANHESTHDPSDRALRHAERMPLVHAAATWGLDHITRTCSLAGNDGKPIFFFSGPSRRKPIGGVAVVLVFAAGVETSRAIFECEASPFDTGTPRHVGMDELERAAVGQLRMDGGSFRSYLAALLHCAFADPGDYLNEEPGPELNHQRPHTLLGRAFRKALEKREDSSCWTVEVRLRPRDEGLPLTCPELEGICIVGDEHEPLAAELEALVESKVAFLGGALDISSAERLVEALDRREHMAVEARAWSIEKVRQLVQGQRR